MKKIIFIGGIILFLVMLAATFGGNNSNKILETKEPLQQKATLQNKRVEKAEVVSKQWLLTEEAEISSTREIVLTGIIKNTGNVPLVLNQGTGVLYGEQRKILAQTHGLFHPPIIPPEEQAYISFGFLDSFFEPEVKFQDVVDAEIQFSYSYTEGLMTSHPLEIFQAEGGIKGSFGHFEIVGEVKNPLDKKAKGVKTCALYYDSDGKLIDVQETFLNDIEPNKQVAFSITNTDFSKKIKSYKVFAYSDELK